MEKYLGMLTMIFSLAMAVIALPHQIYKNKKEKSCGIGIYLILLSCAVYGTRIPYSFLAQAWFIIVPDTFGLICSSVMLYQYFKYKTTP